MEHDDYNGEDVGGNQYDHDAWLEEIDRISGIKEDRKRRVRSLSGKYVVATKGRSSNKTVFFQDKSISKGGYWTQYLSNALGFNDLSKARLIASGFKYGEPKIAIINAQGNYQWVK